MFRLICLVLIFFPAQILSTWKFPVSESITKRFFNLNYFRKSRQIHPVFSNDETINFDQVLSRKDMLSNICDDLFMIICDYLDSASLLILRSSNKELLKGYTQVMNLRFMKQLQPRISFDPRLFEEKRLASTFLNSFNYYSINLIHQEYLYDSNLIITLSTGQKEELDVVIADLSRPSNNFENFLRLAILFYNYTDAMIFWNLIEASMKSDILHLSDLNFIPQINYKIAFESACDWGLQNLSKELLMRVEELSLDLIDGCVRCINNGEHIVLKNILKSVLKLNYFNPEMIKFLLETSIKKIELESVEILFQHFDFLRFMDTDIIFWIIKNKNYPLLEILLKYRGDVDFTILDEDGHSPFDISAQHDFWQGIDSMSHVYRNPSIKIYSQALVFAILNQNYLSLQSLIFEINRKFGSFSSALKKAIIIGLIMDALKTRNLSILKLILINSPRNILIIERDLAILLGSAVAEYFLNPIFRTVKEDFLEGFICLLDHFGPGLLDQRNQKGLTPFLMAASLGNTKIFRSIYFMRIESVGQTDCHGNNALHLALKYLSDPMPFIKEILDLNLDWDHLNRDNQSPVDLLINLNCISSEDFIMIYNVLSIKYE